mmetsp:Transcript_12029/g.10409  ORF Transcript_12029/g.10409 Transcript_12029/m.10409 type:complete len:194 (-) Transcript_12029:241-822(-)
MKATTIAICLTALLGLSFAQNCDDQKTKFNCQTIVACQDSSGVCQCANGNQCVWNNNEAQTVNCPCFDGTTDFDWDGSCNSKFEDNNCGYETTCNSNINAGTCKCQPSVGTTCIWNDQIDLNCPCPSTPDYPSEADYKSEKFAACQDKIDSYNCVSNGVTNCMDDVGSCTCTDGSLCAWGPNYDVGCPCPASS